MFYRVFILLCLLLTGCSQTWEKNPERQYSYHISDKFSPEHRQTIFQAIRNWEASLNGYLSFQETELPSSNSINFEPSSKDDLNKFNPNTDKHRIGWCGYRGIGSKVEIAVDIDEADFSWVGLHEIGH